MRQIKQLTYFLLANAVSGLIFEDVRQGHCTLKKGDVKLDQIDVNDLKGFWINVFDKVEVNEGYWCYSVELSQMYANEDDTEEERIKRSKIFDFNQFAMPTEQNEADVPNFKMFYNMALSFGEGSDPTSSKVNPFGYLETSQFIYTGDLEGEHLLDGKKEPEFDASIWESQYNRHVQVLHTDTDYMVLYQCMEAAEYLNPFSHNSMRPEEAWKKATQTSIDFDKKPFVSYTLPENKVTVEPIHFEKVMILWKPERQPADDNDGLVGMPKDPKRQPNKERIEEIKQILSKKVPQLTELINESHAMMKHDETCSYNPHALDEVDYDVVTYGHDHENSYHDHFHSTEPQPIENFDELPFMEEIDELSEDEVLEGELDENYDGVMKTEKFQYNGREEYNDEHRERESEFIYENDPTPLEVDRNDDWVDPIDEAIQANIPEYHEEL